VGVGGGKAVLRGKEAGKRWRPGRLLPCALERKAVAVRNVTPPHRLVRVCWTPLLPAARLPPPTRLRWPRPLDLCPSAVFCLYPGLPESPPPMLVRNGSLLADTHLPNGPMGLALLREKEMRMLITFSLAMVALLAGHTSSQSCPRRPATRAGLTGSINQSDVAGACNIRPGYKRQLQHKSPPYPSTSYRIHATRNTGQSRTMAAAKEAL
jgi:hypothetical protein